jgi:hypothetical protein
MKPFPGRNRAVEQKSADRLHHLIRRITAPPRLSNSLLTDLVTSHITASIPLSCIMLFACVLLLLIVNASDAFTFSGMGRSSGTGGSWLTTAQGSSKAIPRVDLGLRYAPLPPAPASSFWSRISDIWSKPEMPATYRELEHHLALTLLFDEGN